MPDLSCRERGATVGQAPLRCPEASRILRMASPDDDEIRALAARVAKHLLRGGRGRRRRACPGGWVAKACTDLPGSSAWFLGGVVTYSNEAKVALLEIDEGTLSRAGAVSEAVVARWRPGRSTGSVATYRSP